LIATAEMVIVRAVNATRNPMGLLKKSRRILAESLRHGCIGFEVNSSCKDSITTSQNFLVRSITRI
jgi:hypothetical protein